MEPFEIKNTLTDLDTRMKALRSALNIETLMAEVAEMEGLMGAADFWNDQEKAQGIIEELKKRKTVVEPLLDAEGMIADMAELFAMAEAEGDADTFAQIAEELTGVIAAVEALETRSLLSGKNDACNVFFSLHSGAGGNDACEWTEMLRRMYLRAFERRGWKIEELDLQPGDEAGLKGATYRVAGENVYGYLRSEIGVHRLVRISPFSGKRETSFAGVDVIPESESADITIDEKDLRIDTYRSGGKGGQHVNKTDSAVRITHLPTGVVVAVQNERSQHKNKALAFKLLAAKLSLLDDLKREKEMAALYSEKGEIAFGSQIRNYVLHPYTQVKDTRTGCERGDVQSVLDGEIDAFAEAYLRWSVERRKQA